MERYQLEQYIAVVEAGSISQAAKVLYLAQPNLSKSIQNLEDELDQKLLIRSNKGIKTTPAGKELYYHAKSIIGRFQLIEDWKNVYKQTLPCYLNIAVSSLFLDDRILYQFYKQNKAIETYIRLYETTPKFVLEDIVIGKAELGIVVLNDQILPTFFKMAESKEIAIQVLDRKPYCLHFHQQSKLSVELKKDLRILEDYIWIHLPLDFFGYLNASLLQYDFVYRESQKRIVTNNYHSMIQLLKTVDSFLFGNIWQKEKLEQLQITSVSIPFIEVEQNFLILHKKRETLSKTAKAYLKILKDIYQL